MPIQKITAENILLSKEEYDCIEHGNYSFEQFESHPEYNAAENGCPFLSQSLSSREATILVYIWWSLAKHQEYDAGNAILFASQTGALGGGSIEKIALYFCSSVKFKSKIGKILYVRIARSFGLFLFRTGSQDIGKVLLRKGIEVTKSLKYGREAEVRKWHEVPDLNSLPTKIQEQLIELS